MSNSRIYRKNKAEGDFVEGFVRKYMGQVTGLDWLPNSVHKLDEYTEGRDKFGIAIIPVTNGLHAAVGNLECKGIMYGKVLKYYKYGNIGLPTLEFELWSDWTEEKKGWLYAMLHPEQFNAEREAEGSRVRVSFPAAFTYVCCDKGRVYRPFMAITFQRFESLVDVLKEYALKDGLDLDEWNFPSSADKEFWGQYPKNYVAENVWNVPMDVVMKAGNVYITMIDDPPKNMSSVEKMRYDYFKAIAYKQEDDVHHFYTAVEDKKMAEVDELNRQEQNTPLQTTPEEAFNETIEQIEASKSIITQKFTSN